MKYIAILLILATVLVIAGVSVSNYKQKAQAAMQSVRNATATVLKSAEPPTAKVTETPQPKAEAAPTAPVLVNQAPNEQPTPATPEADEAHEFLQNILKGESPVSKAGLTGPSVAVQLSSQPNLHRLLEADETNNNR